MKTIVKIGYTGINHDLDKYANSPAALAKLEKDKVSFSKIKNLDTVKGYREQK